jgi:hypothetical protein
MYESLAPKWEDKLMNCEFIKKLAICFAIGFFTVSVFFAAGCAPKKVRVVYGKDRNSGYSEGGYEHEHEKKGGPPPHAPAHGYRAKHHYRYYPSRSVYYDTGRGLYFYIKGNNWEVGASLPGNLRVGLGDSVIIELDTDKPYLYHAEHMKKYPPGQMRKKKHKKKNKWG